MGFRTALALLIVVVACGPKPDHEIRISPAPAAAWHRFTQAYNNLTSLALSGDFSIENKQAYDCNLQLLYAAPDSFAFLAEGTLGIDLARGAILGDTGFWEVPRQGINEEVWPGDLLILPDNDTAIDIEVLVRAVFFFRQTSDYEYQTRSGSKLNFVRQAGDSVQVIELSRDSATPASQTFISADDTIRVSYSDWHNLATGLAFPHRIDISSTVSGMKITYLIKKSKYNPNIDLSNFLPKS